MLRRPCRGAPRQKILPGSSGRFLLEAGATVATALGITAAVLAPDPTRSAPAADAEPDAALIAACDRFIRVTDTYNAAGSPLEPEDDPLWA